MTTITIIFWIFLTLYRVLTTKPAPSVDPKLLEPINATLDIQSLEKINSRIFFEEGSFVPPVVQEGEEVVQTDQSQVDEVPIELTTTPEQPEPTIITEEEQTP